jgi:iron complex transport system permease protein
MAIVWRARVPRVLVAALVGASLAAAGAMLQLLLRNPLADPFVLGVSSGAAFGSVLGLALGITLSGGAHPLAATAGAAAAGVLVHALGRERGRLSPERVVLAGVVLSYLLAAAIMWLISLSSAVEAQRYIFWLMGSLASASGPDAGGLAVVILAATLLALPVLPALDLILVSDAHASASGVRVERVKALVFASAALLTGGCVAVAGSIGFVGLVVPHSVRLLGARDARLSVPVSALAGASFLVLVDLGSRALGEIPVGVVTASFGAPFFLWLLARRRIA